MTSAEMVTDFKLEEADGKPVTLSAIVRAVAQHCETILDGESFCDLSAWERTEEGKQRRLPARFRGLIAFAQDGENEGYYVHIGVMLQYSDGNGGPGGYLDMGFAKVWTPAQAQEIATEAQRFLSAARWN